MNTQTAHTDAPAPGEAARFLARLQDPEFRARIRQLDADALAELGYRPAPGAAPPGPGGPGGRHGPDGDIEFKVVTSRRDTTFVPLPEIAADAALTDADLLQLQAAGTGTVSSVGSAGSIGTLTSTLSTVGSAGTVGSADVGAPEGGRHG
ncbi:MAG: thiocillin family RiPP [Gammaproteobacteria bacterium]|nr:thiocillin family RiPP [Gammaproteobacteria bacterium]